MPKPLECTASCLPPSLSRAAASTPSSFGYHSRNCHLESDSKSKPKLLEVGEKVTPSQAQAFIQDYRSLLGRRFIKRPHGTPNPFEEACWWVNGVDLRRDEPTQCIVLYSDMPKNPMLLEEEEVVKMLADSYFCVEGGTGGLVREFDQAVHL
ncbi:hypothetical protein BDN72DRAFT_64429 [Pluteus cervinus]|uniref:Uncharacterized protein n=1 Tax=Pluteus cervinus TaxID=181527 RepID=A0ACD3ARZ7_9AGAR|nr:hypothetical protein BDN72DRAFT_64429 [Pluteus cervinus]